MFFMMLLKQLFAFISYVSSYNSFPKPLSVKEEQRLLELYANGDIDAKNKLIEHNLRLVAHIAKKYSGAGKDADDYISIGTIGLIKGINSFNTKKGAKLSTYISRCIDNEILMFIRSNKKIQNEVSIDEPIGVDFEGNQITFNSILCSNDDEVCDAINNKMLVNKLYDAVETSLSPRERDIIIMRYGLNGTREMTQKEVAKKLNISRSYISRIEKKAIEILKEKMFKTEHL